MRGVRARREESAWGARREGESTQQRSLANTTTDLDQIKRHHRLNHLTRHIRDAVSPQQGGGWRPAVQELRLATTTFGRTERPTPAAPSHPAREGDAGSTIQLNGSRMAVNGSQIQLTRQRQPTRPQRREERLGQRVQSIPPLPETRGQHGPTRQAFGCREMRYVMCECKLFP